MDTALREVSIFFTPTWAHAAWVHTLSPKPSEPLKPNRSNYGSAQRVE